MKKRISGILIVLCMIICLFPVAAQAAEISYVSTEAELTGAVSYYNREVILTRDIYLTSPLTISHETTLDLNGKTLGVTTSDGQKVIYVPEGGMLTLKDSSALGDGKIDGGGHSRGVHVESGTFIMNSGVITNCVFPTVGGGVYVEHGIFTMNGGRIFGCDSGDGGGAYISPTTGTVFTMNGGEIYDCCSREDSVCVESNATMIANGGTITSRIGFALENGRTVTTESGCTGTVFKGAVYSWGPLGGGIYYGEISYRWDKNISGIMVTFEDGNDTYARVIIPSGEKAIKPVSPVKDELLFTGWFTADGNRFDFSTPLTEDITLTAGWFDPAAGGSGEKGDPGITPELRINAATNEWEVSYDNGWTWITMGVKATGQQGEEGAPGRDGTDGEMPRLMIGSDGYWYISYDEGMNWTSLGVNAMGEKGEKGDKGDKGDTGEKGDKGDPGEKGDRGDTGYTGFPGQKGEKGDTGPSGRDGKDGSDGLIPYIGINGNWWIGATDTGIKATGNDGADGSNGKDGTNGINGKDGKDGKGISKTEINSDGRLIITYTDGTVADLGTVVGADSKDGLTPFIGSNGNWWIGQKDTGVKAAAEVSVPAGSGAVSETGMERTVTLIAIAAVLALAGNIGLAVYIVLKRKTGRI